MEQKTKEKVFCRVRKLITLLRSPQQEALGSGHQILGEANREGRRKWGMPKGWGVHENPASDTSSRLWLCINPQLFVSLERVCVFSKDWVKCESLYSCGWILFLLWKAEEQPRAGLSTAWCRTKNSNPWIYSTAVRLITCGTNWRQNKCRLLGVLLDSIGWEENTQIELCCVLAALAAAWGAAQGEKECNGEYSRNSANSTSLVSNISIHGAPTTSQGNPCQFYCFSNKEPYI